MKNSVLILALSALIALGACNIDPGSGTSNLELRVNLSLDYSNGTTPSGHTETGRAVNVWIEDQSGNYVDTVVRFFGESWIGGSPGNIASNWPSEISGPGNVLFDYLDTGPTYSSGYPNDISSWASTAPGGISGNRDGEVAIVDGVSLATFTTTSPSSYRSTSWDFRDRNGSVVSSGTYVLKVEFIFDDDSHNTNTPRIYSTSVSFGSSSQNFTLTEEGSGNPSDNWLSSGVVEYIVH